MLDRTYAYCDGRCRARSSVSRAVRLTISVSNYSDVFVTLVGRRSRAQVCSIFELVEGLCWKPGNILLLFVGIDVDSTLALGKVAPVLAVVHDACPSSPERRLLWLFALLCAQRDVVESAPLPLVIDQVKVVVCGGANDLQIIVPDQLSHKVSDGQN